MNIGNKNCHATNCLGLGRRDAYSTPQNTSPSPLFIPTAAGDARCPRLPAAFAARPAATMISALNVRRSKRRWWPSAATRICWRQRRATTHRSCACRARLRLRGTATTLGQTTAPVSALVRPTASAVLRAATLICVSPALKDGRGYPQTRRVRPAARARRASCRPGRRRRSGPAGPLCLARRRPPGVRQKYCRRRHQRRRKMALVFCASLQSPHQALERRRRRRRKEDGRRAVVLRQGTLCT